MPNRFWGAVQRGLGRVADGFVPGDIYNPQTNTYQNVWKGVSMMPIVAAANLYGGPFGGLLAKRVTSNYVDGKNLLDFSKAASTQDPTQAGPAAAQTQGGVSMGNPVATRNLGLPTASMPQSPGSSWAGYMQSPGSLNNFGNTQFGTGQPQLGTWQPSSIWGQTIAAGNGSNLGFGNNVSAVTGGGGGSSAGVNSGSRGAGGGMPGIVGGNAAGQTVLDIWRGRYQQN